MNSGQLKILAMCSMLADHIAVVFLPSEMPIYWALRGAGRLAFPLFCFLITEGYKHTKNKRRYALRLFLFAVVSEVPFDLCFYGKAFYWGYQNVGWTLLLGFMGLWIFEKLQGHTSLAMLGVGVCAMMDCLLRCDYALWGVFAVFGLSFMRLPKWVYNGEKGKIGRWGVTHCICWGCLSQGSWLYDIRITSTTSSDCYDTIQR